MAALVAIEKAEPVALGDLARLERVRPPSMTRIVAGIEEMGLVRRVVDGNDGNF
jgi:DNA-binding MarR family transcriptional regulator